MANRTSEPSVSRAKQPASKPRGASGETPSSTEWAAVSWLRSHALAVAIALIAIGSVRIVATYTVFNDTSDETAHIACGMEWLDKGIYHYEPQHPPLARVATALGPYLAGVHSQSKPRMYDEGAAILYSGKRYDHNLILARLGILPFFWIASLTVYFWTRRYFGALEAVTALSLFTFLPPVLAHAGLATTDMALTAMCGVAFVSAVIWTEEPTFAHSAIFGACTGLAALSKFTSLPFLPCAMAAGLIWYFAVARPDFASVVAAVRQRALPFLLASVVGALVIWAGYRFSFGSVPFASFRLPAPELYAGIKQVIDHNNTGHAAYLFGKRSGSGWWYYFPVMLAVKTPLPFLALLFLGAAICIAQGRKASRGLWLPLAFSLGILVFSLFARINIGVRHILPVYIGFSIVAAAGAVRLLQAGSNSTGKRWTLALLLLWMAATSGLSHPDYLPYFNALAGNEPEKIAVDSDLDWGQDMKRLASRLRELDVRQVAFNPLSVGFIADTNAFPVRTAIDPETPSAGWNAVSLTMLKAARLGLYDQFPEARLWPERMKPTEKVGKSIWLYYIPPTRPGSQSR